jgi:DNA-binding MarR family transcriptional regulator
VSADRVDDGRLRELVDVDRAIHEPARLVIVAILSVVESADFVYLQNETGLTAGNLSSHLSKLEAAGYVAIEKGFEGKIPHTTCQLTPSGQTAFEEYRAQMETALKVGKGV